MDMRFEIWKDLKEIGYEAVALIHLRITEHHAMKGCWGSGGVTPLILELRHFMGVSGQLHAPAALLPRERSPGTHWIGGWVGSRTEIEYAAVDLIHLTKNRVMKFWAPVSGEFLGQLRYC
jgi:hypothetical protein